MNSYLAKSVIYLEHILQRVASTLPDFNTQYRSFINYFMSTWTHGIIPPISAFLGGGGGGGGGVVYVAYIFIMLICVIY